MANINPKPRYPERRITYDKFVHEYANIVSTRRLLEKADDWKIERALDDLEDIRTRGFGCKETNLKIAWLVKKIIQDYETIGFLTTIDVDIISLMHRIAFDSPPYPNKTKVD